MMKIPVKCKCGKVLYVPSQYAGKKGRCPQCARLLIVPESKEEKIEETPQPSKVCPTCGAYLSQEDEICVSCKMNLKTGHWDMVEKQAGIDSEGMKTFTKVLILCLIASLSMIGYLLFMVKNRDAIAQSSLFQEEKLYKETKEKALKEKNPFRIWWEWIFLKKFFTTKEYKDKIQEELSLTKVEMKKFLKERREEFHQLFQEHRVNEVMTRVTPKILQTLGECWEPLCQDKESWHSLLSLYEKFTLEGKKDNLAAKQYESYSLDNYKKQFLQDLPYFKKCMYLREYDDAQKKLETLWQSIHSLEYLNTEEPLVVEIRGLLKDVQSIKALLSLANEGAKESVGLNKPFITRQKQVIYGTVVQYVLGNFFIKTEESKTIKIFLKNLHSKEIVFFALSTQKNKHVYLYAGIFYLYEKAYSLAQEAFSNALKLGADPSEIEHYSKILQQAAKEKKEN